jgi:hypothetical protein
MVVNETKRYRMFFYQGRIPLLTNLFPLPFHIFSFRNALTTRRISAIILAAITDVPVCPLGPRVEKKAQYQTQTTSSQIFSVVLVLA